jgi:hypothetical protein
MIVYVNAEATVEVAQDGNEGCCAACAIAIWCALFAVT